MRSAMSKGDFVIGRRCGILSTGSRNIRGGRLPAVFRNRVTLGSLIAPPLVVSKTAVWLTVLLAGTASTGVGARLDLPHDPPAAAARVYLADPVFGAAVRRAIAGAAARLERTECQRVFADFSDESGRSLLANLQDSNRRAAEYLFSHVSFVDDSDAPQCLRGDVVAAFTTPGDPVIRLCASEFARSIAKNATATELLVIHEMLHALGLGENPPTPDEITARLRARCSQR